jgi:hypothetical protein
MSQSDHQAGDGLLLLMAFVGGAIVGATLCERGFWRLLADWM